MKLSSLFSFFNTENKNILPEKYISGNTNSQKLNKTIKECLPLIEKMVLNYGSYFEIKSDKLYFYGDNKKLRINNNEELFIVNEVFNELSYNFNINKDLFIIDVGANIGASILYFSSFESVKKICGFEPVKETFDYLVENLNINDLSTEVEVMNFGLSECNKQTFFEFSPNFKGSVGVQPLSETIKNKSDFVNITDVELKDGAVIIAKIIEDASLQSCSVLIKIDCEGCEFALLKRLHETQLLDKISYIIMEWHGKNMPTFKTELEHFDYFSFKNSDKTGMLYAIKK
jgi:FkbM family methyltransferase